MSTPTPKLFLSRLLLGTLFGTSCFMFVEPISLVLMYNRMDSWTVYALSLLRSYCCQHTYPWLSYARSMYICSIYFPKVPRRHTHTHTTVCSLCPKKSLGSCFSVLLVVHSFLEEHCPSQLPRTTAVIQSIPS